MSENDVLDRDTVTEPATEPGTEPLVEFLESEFPDWSFSVDATETWRGPTQSRWVATKDGHHPQAELTAGKLHRRLSDYLAREAARFGDN